MTDVINKEDPVEEDLFKFDQPYEGEDKDDPTPDASAGEQEDPDNDKDEEEKKGVDFEKRFNDSQLFIEELRNKNTEQEDSIIDLKGRLKHLEDVTKKTHEVINPDEEYAAYEAPEKPNAAVEWADDVTKEEEALVSVFSDYYEIVGSNGQSDSPFLKAIENDPKLFDQVRDAKRPAAEAYKIGLDYKLSQAKKKETPNDPTPTKRKSPSLRDAPGSNIEPSQKPEDSLGAIFKK